MFAATQNIPAALGNIVLKKSKRTLLQHTRTHLLNWVRMSWGSAQLLTMTCRRKLSILLLCLLALLQTAPHLLAQSPLLPPPQPLQRVMSVAARARNAPRYQRREEEPHLTPPRQPLPGPAAAAFMDPPTPDPAPPLSSHPAPGSASTTPRPAFVTRVPTWLSNGAG